MRRSPLLLFVALLVVPAYSQEPANFSVDSLILQTTVPWSSSAYDRSALQGDPTRSLEGLMVRTPGVTNVSTQ